MSLTLPDDSLLRSLNDAQRRAVTSSASTVAILAGPGSGKTHTLTSRVVWLIRHMGYRPSDVIVATFTIKAAKEMKQRIGRILGEEVEKKIILGTFHSIARRYLSIYGHQIGLDSKFNIADDGDSKAIIQRICKRLDLKVEPSAAKSWISKRKATGKTAEGSQRNQPKKRDHPDLLKCFEEYQEHLERSNMLDFDDLLVKCVELLRNTPECVSNVQTVLIDEYQDTNGIQYELMKLFAQTRQRITIVGDPDQSIYGWRSAEVRNLYKLLREYPGTEEVSLEENYRSSQHILDVSLQVIQEDKNRYKKILRPVHTKCTQPVLRSLGSSSLEGEWIVSEIKRMVMMFGSMLKYEDIAILLRSASLSRHIESALGKAGIAYRMVGGSKFYERKEIKILLDYLRVVHQPDNNDAVARIINVPRRGIGEVTIKALLEEAEKAKMPVWSVLCKHCRGERKAETNIRANMEQKISSGLMHIIFAVRRRADGISQDGSVTLVDVVESLLTHLNFKKYLESEYPEEHESRWANVQEFLNLVRDFMRDYSKLDDDEELPQIEDLTQVKDEDVLGKFLANVSLASDAQRNEENGDKSSLVTISTIHAAKGLEWPLVFVPSVYTGSIPHSRSEDLDEERRLLYVAMTRAQAMLNLSCPLYGPQGLSNKVELSSFVSLLASKAFAPRGPSIDARVLQSVAKILGREAPPERDVFEKLPSMFSPEDDTFPVNPIDVKNPERTRTEMGDPYARATKRQRTNHPGNNGIDDERPWVKDYSTTMESSGNFTMSSLSGFVTAGQHQTAMAALMANSGTKTGPDKQAAKKGTTRRGVDQKSLLGFVSKGNVATAQQVPKENRTSTYSAQRPADAIKSGNSLTTGVTEKPVLNPALAQHKIGMGKPTTRPPPSKPAEDGPRNQYACFSSSPPRASTPDELASKPPEEEAQTSRPATVLHSTTFSMAGPRRGVRRPVGMGPPPSMDRLRKPFKPLTINRSRGQPK